MASRSIFMHCVTFVFLSHGRPSIRSPRVAVKRCKQFCVATGFRVRWRVGDRVFRRINSVQCDTMRHKGLFPARCFLLIYLPTRARYNYWQTSGVACNTIGNPSVFSENFHNWKTQYLTLSAPKCNKTHRAEDPVKQTLAQSKWDYISFGKRCVR